MGIYLNPGKDAFEEAVRSDIFVDKTEMIMYLNSVIKTRQKYLSVSSPRRFGKTMAADMTTFNGHDDVLALLIHLGYLRYDSTTGEVFIPNKEILVVFRASTKSPEWDNTFETLRLSQEIL